FPGVSGRLRAPAKPSVPKMTRLTFPRTVHRRCVARRSAAGEYRNFPTGALLFQSMRTGGKMTSTTLTSACGFIAGSVMMLSFAAIPVSAQGLPNGSYLQSCRNVAVHGDRLLADCRRTDGRWARTALQNVDRCVGDIGNMNGQLACNHAGGN